MTPKSISDFKLIPFPPNSKSSSRKRRGEGEKKKKQKEKNAVDSLKFPEARAKKYREKH